MSKIQNEKLKAIFNWIKTPKSTFFLLLANFISFCFSQNFPAYNKFYFFVMLLGNLFAICLIINLIYISLSEFLLFSILSFVLVALSAVFIGGSHFEDLNIAILALSIPIFLCKLIYTLTARSTSSQNLKNTNTNIQKKVTKRRQIST